MTCIVDFGEGGRSVCVLLHRWQRSERKRGGGWGGGDEPSAATCHCSPLLPPLSALWQTGSGRESDPFVFVREWVCSFLCSMSVWVWVFVNVCVHGCMCLCYLSLYICSLFLSVLLRLLVYLWYICKFASMLLTRTVGSITFLIRLMNNSCYIFPNKILYIIT